MCLLLLLCHITRILKCLELSAYDFYKWDIKLRKAHLHTHEEAWKKNCNQRHPVLFWSLAYSLLQCCAKGGWRLLRIIFISFFKFNIWIFIVFWISNFPILPALSAHHQSVAIVWFKLLRTEWESGKPQQNIVSWWYLSLQLRSDPWVKLIMKQNITNQSRPDQPLRKLAKADITVLTLKQSWSSCPCRCAKHQSGYGRPFCRHTATSQQSIFLVLKHYWNHNRSKTKKKPHCNFNKQSLSVYQSHVTDIMKGISMLLLYFNRQITSVDFFDSLVCRKCSLGKQTIHSMEHARRWSSLGRPILCWQGLACWTKPCAVHKIACIKTILASVAFQLHHKPVVKPVQQFLFMSRLGLGLFSGLYSRYR